MQNHAVSKFPPVAEVGAASCLSHKIDKFFTSVPVQHNVYLDSVVLQLEPNWLSTAHCKSHPDPASQVLHVPCTVVTSGFLEMRVLSGHTSSKKV